VGSGSAARQSLNAAKLRQRRSKGESEGSDSRMAAIRKKCRSLCDNWRWNVLTTVLTIYALFGDDFRLAATPKSRDVLFNFFTIIVILVFSAEIVISSLGQAEYFLGFFFVLDFCSTVTLFFDITWIGDAIFCSEGDSSGALRTSRAGRAGARASRTVRIIRLMRLVKLYKTYKTAVEQKNQQLRRNSRTGRTSQVFLQKEGAVLPGEGDDVDLLSSEDHEEGLLEEGDAAYLQTTAENGEPKAETRVGKKLSDMTTRRVIVLVLVMLFMMPMFTTSFYGTQEFKYSANLGADLVYERWRTWCMNEVSAANSAVLPWCLQGLATPADELEATRKGHRARFEKALLHFIYHHHQGDFSLQLYWIGINSTSLVEQSTHTGSHDAKATEAKTYLSQMGRLNQLTYLGSEKQYLGTQQYLGIVDSTSAWDDWFIDPGFDMISLTALAPSIRDALTQPWRENCRSGNFVGVKVQTSEVEYEEECSINDELRCSEVDWYFPLSRTEEEDLHMSFVFAFDMRATTRLEASLSMLQTIFICISVALGALTFSKDANELLLNPIERMIAKMETIKDNPLAAMRLGDLEHRREEIEAAQREQELSQMSRCWKLIYKYKFSKKVKEPMETVMLEKTIIKLGGLLALGFGEAGAEIIGQNMGGGASAGVQAMASGQKVGAIIGFCSIRHFTDATEVLKEKVMLFVNQVAEIVHGCVDDYHGAPNKNIGDSFLLIWRLAGTTQERQAKLADMAMMSFIKIIAEINKSRVIAVYRSHPGLLQRLPNYRVQMGFGLHCGWTIEGAIGSEFKIDVSYLSPNVNVASRLEAATIHYGTWILISHFMIGLCSQEMALLCRLIDHVTVKGSKHSVRLYTIDLDCTRLEVQWKAPERVIKNRFKIRQLREVRKNEKWNDDYNVWEVFETDEDIISMRALYTTEFFQRFSMAYRNYEAGEWMAARDMLFTCHYSPKSDVGRFMVTNEAEWPEDGPTVTLLNFMRQFDYSPPLLWPGYHDIPDR